MLKIELINKAIMQMMKAKHYQILVIIKIQEYLPKKNVRKKTKIKMKSSSSVKLKITEHYEIKSKENTSETQNISNNKEENQL